MINSTMKSFRTAATLLALVCAGFALSGCVTSGPAGAGLQTQATVNQTTSLVTIVGDAVASAKSCAATLPDGTSLTDLASDIEGKVNSLVPAVNTTEGKVNALSQDENNLLQRVQTLEQLQTRLETARDALEAARPLIFNLLYQPLITGYNSQEKQAMHAYALRLIYVATLLQDAYASAGRAMPLIGGQNPASAMLTLATSLRDQIDADGDESVMHDTVQLLYDAFVAAGDLISGELYSLNPNGVAGQIKAAKDEIDFLQKGFSQEVHQHTDSFPSLAAEAAGQRDELRTYYNQLAEAIETAGCSVPPLSDFDLNVTLEGFPS